MHIVLAVGGEAVEHDLRAAAGQPVATDLIAEDSRAFLDEEAVSVEGYACAASCACLRGLPEPANVVGLAIAVGVPQRDDEAAGGRRLVAEIFSAPGVGEDRPIRPDRQMAGVANPVGEYCCAEARR